MTDIAKKYKEQRIKFFKALAVALKNDKWSNELVTSVEVNCGFNIGYHHVLFSGGQTEILLMFEQWQDELMIEQVKKVKRPKKTCEQIALALEIRLMNVSSKNVVLNNSAFFMIPSNILTGNKATCHTCDLIWKYAGDKSIGFNYYTKRGLLLPVYLSAKTFYFADNSENYQDTKAFIKNALDNIIKIISLKSKVNLPKMRSIPILRLFS